MGSVSSAAVVDDRMQNRVFWTRYSTQSGQFARARIRQGAVLSVGAVDFPVTLRHVRI